MKVKLIFFISIAFVLLTLSVIFMHHQGGAPLASTGGSNPQIGGVFELVDSNGKPFSSKHITTPYKLIYFGFTHCPDICPTGLQHISEALASNPKLAEKVTPIFITLDPARDTPEVMKDYVEALDKKLLGLTGTQAQIDTVATAYKVYHSKQVIEGSAGEYVIDHSSWIYLTNDKDEYVAHYKHDLDSQALAEELKKYVD